MQRRREEDERAAADGAIGILEGMLASSRMSSSFPTSAIAAVAATAKQAQDSSGSVLQKGGAACARPDPSLMSNSFTSIYRSAPSSSTTAPAQIPWLILPAYIVSTLLRVA